MTAWLELEPWGEPEQAAEQSLCLHGRVTCDECEAEELVEDETR